MYCTCTVHVLYTLCVCTYMYRVQYVYSLYSTVSLLLLILLITYACFFILLSLHMRFIVPIPKKILISSTRNN